MPSIAEELAAETRNAVHRAFGSLRKGFVVRRDFDTGVASPCAGRGFLRCSIAYSEAGEGRPPPDRSLVGTAVMAPDRALKMAAGQA